MKEYFFTLSSKVLDTLSADENLTISINGENSQFIRINNAKVRQIGEVFDSSLNLEFIKNNLLCLSILKLNKVFRVLESAKISILRKY